MFKDHNQIDSGDYSANTIGNDNTVNNYYVLDTRQPKRSVLTKVCLSISNSDLSEETSYDLDSNSDWIKKYEYNDVNVFQEIFEIYSLNYPIIEQVLINIPEDREIMIRKIRVLYLQTKNRTCEDSIYTSKGDQILERIFSQIRNIVFDELGDDSSRDQIKYIEEYEESIYLIMFYSFTKCKILEKPI